MTIYTVDPDGIGDGTGIVLTSIGAVNFLTEEELPPGSTVRFKRGAIFRERLICTVSGSKDEPIHYVAYGEGFSPAIHTDFNLFAAFGYGFLNGEHTFTILNEEVPNIAEPTQDDAYSGDWSLELKRDVSAPILRVNLQLAQPNAIYHISCWVRRFESESVDGLSIRINDSATNDSWSVENQQWESGPVVQNYFRPSSTEWEEVGFDFPVHPSATEPHNIRMDFAAQDVDTHIYIDALYLWERNEETPGTRLPGAGTYGYLVGAQIDIPDASNLRFNNIAAVGPMENDYWERYGPAAMGNTSAIFVGLPSLGPDDPSPPPTSGNIIFRGMECVLSPGVGWWINRESPGIYVDDAHIAYNRNTGIYQNADRGSVTNSYIHNNGNNFGPFDRGGIGIQGGHLYIYNNDVIDNGNENGLSDSAISTAAHFGPLWIIGNYVESWHAGITVANDRSDLYPHEDYKCIVAYNIVNGYARSQYDHENPGEETKGIGGVLGWSGIRIGAVGTAVDENSCWIQAFCTNVEVLNNIIVNGGTPNNPGPFTGWTQVPLSVARWDNRNFKIKNNIVMAFDKAGASVVALQFSSAVSGPPEIPECEDSGFTRETVWDGAEIDHNVYEDNCDFTYRNNGNPPIQIDFTAWQANEGLNGLDVLDSNTLILDPGTQLSDVFTMEGSRREQFRLKPGSPVLGMGFDHGGGVLPYDIEGTLIFDDREVGCFQLLAEANHLTWTEPTERADGSPLVPIDFYTINYGGVDTNLLPGFLRTEILPGNVFSFDIPIQLEPGKTYRARISATDMDGKTSQLSGFIYQTVPL